MILWEDGAHAARANMARDAALLERTVAGALTTPVLRLYGFAGPAITLGRSQEPGRELDLAAVAGDGVAWAIRPTGGRAVFHDGGWTFSLVATLGPHRWAATAREAYARTGRLLASAFRALGVPADLAPGGRREPSPRGTASGPAAPCFASSSRHELVLGGRKLAGIAQRVQGGCVLQQGSLLTGPGQSRLARYLRADEGTRARVAEELAAAALATDIAAVIAADPGAGIAASGAEPSPARLAEALAGLIPGALRLAGEAGAARLGIRPGVTPAIVLRP